MIAETSQSEQSVTDVKRADLQIQGSSLSFNRSLEVSSHILRDARMKWTNMKKLLNSILNNQAKMIK